MGKAMIMAAALALAFPAAAAAQTDPAPPAVEAAVTGRMHGHFQAYAESARVPGLVWGLVRDGRLVHVGTIGVQDVEQRRPVTADSLFRIASMSKAFTALAVLKLRDEGRLALDAPAELYVPELRGWRYPTSDSPKVTVRDLLNHNAGFVTDNPWGDRQQPLAEADFTRMLEAGVPFTRAPGTAFEYSNFGYALLGRIVGNVGGRIFSDWIRDEIMVPLGMTETGYEVLTGPQEPRALGYRLEEDAWVREPDMAAGAFGAMGGVQTSARDYARWIAFLLSAWPARDGPEEGPVRRASVREMAEGSNFPRSQQRPGLAEGEECRFAAAYAMGLTVAEDCDLGTILTHSGGYPGYGSYMMLLPDHATGLFAFANRTYAAPIQPLVQAALELHRADLLEERVWPVSDRLAAAYRSVGAMYAAGRIEPEALAMNFLMDRSAEDWTADLASLRARVGTCETSSPLVASGLLEGGFAWTCERGTIAGDLLLAPTLEPEIQELRFEVTG